MINKIKLIVIGKIKEQYIQDGINEYLKRLKIFCKIEIIELKDRGIEEDTKNILEIIKKYNKKNVYILDEIGQEKTSIEFSNFIEDSSDEIVFVIGGAFGISNKIKKDYNLISISKMTFTHEMARLFFLEQIYRGFMILNNKSYHK